MREIERKKAAIINVAYYAMILVLGYYFVRYALWLFLPVVIAFVIALILQKPVNAISRKTPVKKGAASVVCVFVLLFALVGVAVLLGATVVNYLKDFIAYITALFDNTDVLLQNIENWALDIIAKLPDGIAAMLSKNVSEIFDSLALMMSGGKGKESVEAVQNGLSFDLSWIMTPVASGVSTAKQLPTMLTSVLVKLIASCFLTSDFDSISRFIRRQLSDESNHKLDRAKELLKSSFGKILKAYGLIIIITFTEMLVGLSVLKLIGVFNSAYIVIIAAATAIIDIVPVLGTGTVIFPWAVYSFIVGNYGLGIGLLVIYAVITVIRQIIEPKLVAGQLGLPPFVTIIGMFIGLRLFGVAGMFAMPVLIIMLKLLNEEGIIHIWKNKSDTVKADGAEKIHEQAESTD